MENRKQGVGLEMRVPCYS